ncbi:MAG TPA: MBL fold metallo-hydrolase, partial [Tepidisphaeraceae bacterium]|nr:MBL fold metallo-hydrolase [Tepidisphaeraceae bacterium]
AFPHRHISNPSMRIRFCGADRTVTGSSHALEINGLNILLDMGMYQGPRAEADRLNHYLPPHAASASALILSHGHLDHCGKIPVLVKAGFRGPIFCTPGSAEVARVVMNDAAKIQLENCQYLNRRAINSVHPPLAPLYLPEDVPAVLELFHTVPYGQKIDLGKGVSFTFGDAGHILGSANVLLEWTENSAPRRLFFTGDVGRYDAPILRDPQSPAGPVDLLITESTYGNASHGPLADVGPQLLDALKKIIAAKGRLLVPSFAVGRSQTMLWYIQDLVRRGAIPDIPVFIDSPMAVEMTQITQKFCSDYCDVESQALLKSSKELFSYGRLTLASTPQESKRINQQPGPCVIIASSPTCEFGRILYHLTQSVEQPEDMVIFVGWIPPATLGRRIQEGQKRVRILDRWYELRCQVRTIHGLSAHADGDELLRFLAPTLKPRTTAYVVHGEVDQAETFAQRLVAGGVGRAVVPAMESTVIDFAAAPAAATKSPAQTHEEGE